ncbi:MAG: hypothetical protein MJ210_04005 [Alphaproteobacteria bacterium]|nr:hypothetical protein [Alphaproteobacteria bacterium]
MIRDNYLDISKLTTDSEIMNFFEIINRHGGVLRFVGGAVRDALKGIIGSDLNLATDLSPEEMVEICTDEGIETVPLGIKQGSVGIVFGNKIVEVTSLYKYVFNKDETKEIEFTDNWEEDAARRDLTINAVYADEKGNVFDYYNGIEDLEKGYVRFIGSADERIKEDPLRILRYFRFYSLFGLEEPNKKAIEGCRKNAALLKKVPMERIKDELLKIIQTPNAPRAFNLMQANAILSSIMPDAEFIDDLTYFNKIAESTKFENDALIKMFILYRPNVSLAENMAVRLKFNRHDKALFIKLASIDCEFENFLDIKTLKKIIYLHGKDFAMAKLLTEATVQRRMSNTLWAIYDQINQFSEKEFPLRGKDILDLNMCESEQIGNILKDLEQKWMDSDFALSKEELLAQVKTKQVV